MYLSGACSKWPWQEKDEQPQAVEIKSEEEQNVEEDGIFEYVWQFFPCERMFELDSCMNEIFREFLTFLNQI